MNPYAYWTLAMVFSYSCSGLSLKCGTAFSAIVSLCMTSFLGGSGGRSGLGNL